MGAAGLAGVLAAAGFAAGHGALQVERWDAVPCPGCRRDVCFLPEQRLNKCGWCGKVVRHSVE